MIRPLLREALRLVEASAAKEATLRLFGSVAVEFLVSEPTLRRDPPRDIDCVGLGRDLPVLLNVISSLGYNEDVGVTRLFGTHRRMFRQPATGVRIDLCLDILLFCRPIDVRPRLSLRGTTLSVADLLLSKLQAHEMTDADIADVVNLFAAYRPGRTENRDEFDLDALVRECSGDWGLYQLAVDNMKSMINKMGQMACARKGEINDRISETCTALESAPKTLRWRLRAVIGKRLSYYNDVGPEDL